MISARVAEAVEECIDALHEARLKGRADDGEKWAAALREAAVAYRDVVEAEREEPV